MVCPACTRNSPPHKGLGAGRTPATVTSVTQEATEAPRLPRWSALAGILTPVVLIGGWSLAAIAQPDFDSSSQTISALASLSAASRWIMSASLILTGACHVGLAAGLIRVIPRPGPVLLGVGGVATIAVAFVPLACSAGADACGAEPGARAVVHSAVAGVSFVCLSVWPVATAWTLRGQRGPYAVASRPAGVVLVSLLVGFGVAVNGSASEIGLYERVLAGAQALWPAATGIWFLVRRAVRRPRSPVPTGPNK